MIPAKVTICGEVWTVKLKRRLRNKKLGRLNGLCLHSKREIHIDKDLPLEELHETFLHELMHACLPEEWLAKTEEQMIGRISPRLYKVLSSLPDVWL